MNNFYRTLRLIFRYKWTLAASCFTAIMVAVLWGANIGGAYPIIGIINSNQSLQQWIDTSIDTSHKNIVEFEAKVATLEGELAKASESEKRALSTQLHNARGRLNAEEKYLQRCEFFKPYVDTYLPSDPYKTLFVIMMVISAGYILKNIFLVADSILVDRLSNLATLDLRKKFYRRTLRMDLGSFGDARVSELMTRFTYDVDTVNAGIQTVIGRAIREPLKMIGCLIGAAWVCWRLLLISVLIAPLAGYMITRLAKSLKKANRRALEEMSSLYRILSESFTGIKVVKAFTMEPYERRRFHENSKQFFRKAMRISRFDALVSPITEMFGITMICLTILAGTYLVLRNETHLLGIKICDRPLEFTDLAIFYAMLAGSIDPARRLTDVFNRIQRASAAADRVYQLFDREPGVSDPVKPRTLARHHRQIVFENVSFHYNAEQAVLNGINLRIPYGETLAIVGPNGCGKTTLANLIPRFYDPVQGSILLDDVDIRELRMRDLRSQVGMVTQEQLLFDDTVYNNIRYGMPHARRPQVIDAAKKAHAHRFIEEQLEQGYETNVGQLGGRLSGGQRQRIALARAIFCRDPSILILDEATSQIDIESEHLIHKVLEQFTRDRTTIVITHRLQTLDLADRIMVMDQGHIVDLGGHDDLIKRCELYRRLYQYDLRETA